LTEMRMLQVTTKIGSVKKLRKGEMMNVQQNQKKRAEMAASRKEVGAAAAEVCTDAP
jgi:hypothetical protein